MRAPVRSRLRWAVPVAAAGGSVVLLAGCTAPTIARPPLDSPASELASPGAHLTDGDAAVRSALVNASIAERGYYDDNDQAYTPFLSVLQDKSGLSPADAAHVVIAYANATTYCLQGIGDGTSASWYYISSGDHPGLTTTPC